MLLTPLPPQAMWFAFLALEARQSQDAMHQMADSGVTIQNQRITI
jgi:hypothetical protein